MLLYNPSFSSTSGIFNYAYNTDIKYLLKNRYFLVTFFWVFLQTFLFCQVWMLSLNIDIYNSNLASLYFSSVTADFAKDMLTKSVFFMEVYLYSHCFPWIGGMIFKIACCVSYNILRKCLDRKKSNITCRSWKKKLKSAFGAKIKWLKISNQQRHFQVAAVQCGRICLSQQDSSRIRSESAEWTWNQGQEMCWQS